MGRLRGVIRWVKFWGREANEVGRRMEGLVYLGDRERFCVVGVEDR